MNSGHRSARVRYPRSRARSTLTTGVALVVLLLLLGPVGPFARASTPSAVPTSPAVMAACSGPPQLAIAASPMSGIAPLLVQFTSSFSGGCAPFQVDWEFGDGGESGRLNTSHTYLGAGKFFVHAEAHGSNNLSTERQLTINVTGGGGSPKVLVAVLPSSGTAPLSVEAWANVTGGNISDASNVSWTFGDGGGGHGAFVTHVYVTPGNYTVTASIRPPGLPVVKGTASVSVQAPSGGGGGGGPLVLSLTAVPGIVNVPGNVTLTAALSGTGGPFQLSVCFGDGTPCVGGPNGWNGTDPQAFVHSYDTAGNYSIGATVSTTPGTVVAGASALVLALAAPPLTLHASLTGTSTRAPSDTEFLASVSGGTPPYEIRWTFGDGAVGSSIPNVSVIHTYRTAGTFVPAVEVEDAGGNTLNTTLAAVIVLPAVSAGALPPTYLGVPTDGLLLVLLLATLVVGIAYGRWYRRRARMRRLRKEGEDIVRELEESP